MFNTQKAIRHYTNPIVCEYVFEKYLALKDYRESKGYNKRVYDHLGIIDTLGYDSDSGINHFSYSDEGGSIFAIHTGSFWMVYSNYDGKEVYIFDYNPFKEFIDNVHE